MDDVFNRNFARSTGHKTEVESDLPSDFKQMLDVSQVAIAARQESNRRATMFMSGACLLVSSVVLLGMRETLTGGAAYVSAVVFFCAACAK